MTYYETNIKQDVILVEPKIEGNIGAIARLCNNFAINRLVLVAPQVNHLDGEARKRAKHSIKYLEEAVVVNSIEEIKENYSLLIGTSAKAGLNYNVYRQPSFPWNLSEIQNVSQGNMGIIFGREDRGLSNEELRLCDILVNIPIPGDHRVLNISQAVAIILYEIWKELSQTEKRISEERISTSIERKILFDLVEDLVAFLPYEEYRKPIAFHSFTTVVNRSFPTSLEIHSLIGIFKTILHQLKKSGGGE